jgi:farnesyl-diphosphate farnesyltransferase
LNHRVAAAREPLLTDLLRQVSRSFYLTLRVLPCPVRSQIGLAYLLARTTDTIADTEILPVEQRLTALAALRARILGQGDGALNFRAFAAQQGEPAERVLLERVEEGLALLGEVSRDDLQLIRAVLDTIASGQELDLRRFALASAGKIVALETDAELADYTYRVAGCVGEFWTQLCCRHLFGGGSADETRRLPDGIRLGRGLQLVNILRDLPKDLRQGRCYVPLARLRTAGLRAEDLLQAKNEAAFRPVYNSLLDEAEAHLTAGWRYTNELPGNQWRVRLACAWPVLIGVRTIDLLRTQLMLDPARRIKVSRPEVRGILWRSVIRVPFPGAFRKLLNVCPSGGKAVASPGDLA